MNYWLAKQEPSGPRGYNILQLQKDKKSLSWGAGIHANTLVASIISVLNALD